MAETFEEEEHVSSLPFFLPILTRGLGHDGQSGHVRKKHCDLGVHRVRNNKIHSSGECKGSSVLGVQLGFN